MKKVLFILSILLTVSISSCKNDSKNSEATGTQENESKLLDSKYKSYAGEYFYSEDGAVLKGNHFIYAVTMDDLAKELGEKVSSIKKEEYDMVPVVVKGEVKINPAFERGEKVWEQIITIKEIVSVSENPGEIDIKIEEKKS